MHPYPQNYASLTSNYVSQYPTQVSTKIVSSSLLLVHQFIIQHPIFTNCQPSYYLYCIIIESNNGKIQMDILQKAMLRREANIFKLRYAFTSFKLQARVNQLKEKHFSFRDQSDKKHEKPHDIELQNKELYLKYMEEVLDRKEKELMQFEDYLLKHKTQQDQQETKRSILNPLHLTQLAQTLTKKIQVFKDIIQKSSQTSKTHAQLEKLAQSLNVVEQTCRQNYNELKETLLQNHQELVLQKEQLSTKLSKLHELESYQKYLNQLQTFLEHKECEIIRKQSQMKQPVANGSNSQHLSAIPANSPTYNTFQDQEQQSSHSQISTRKRTKIFQHRNSSKPTQISAHHKSSKIMQEKSTQGVLHSPIQTASEHSTMKTQAVMISQATQSTTEDPILASVFRINNQARLVRFLKLWTKFSGQRTKAAIQHRSLMYLYQWRLNTLFDQKIKESVAEMLRWPRCVQPFADFLPLNYAELSLKKKVYLQNFFDYEKRLFQRKKLKNQLLNVIKNKNRKERTAFLLYFRKFRQIVNIESAFVLSTNRQGQPIRDITLQQSQINNSAFAKPFKQSRILSNTSVLLGEDKSKQTISKTRSNRTNTQASQAKLKGRQASVDIAKFRQYIKSQQQNEAKLAIECIRMQAIFRMSSVLSIATTKVFNKFFSGVCRQSDAIRMNSLEKVINGYDFKWQLFTAKIRVALTSNTNKIGHLEQLVAFMGNDK